MKWLYALISLAINITQKVRLTYSMYTKKVKSSFNRHSINYIFSSVGKGLASSRSLTEVLR